MEGPCTEACVPRKGVASRYRKRPVITPPIAPSTLSRLNPRPRTSAGTAAGVARRECGSALPPFALGGDRRPEAVGLGPRHLRPHLVGERRDRRRPLLAGRVTQYHAVNGATPCAPT